MCATTHAVLLATPQRKVPDKKVAGSILDLVSAGFPPASPASLAPQTCLCGEFGNSELCGLQVVVRWWPPPTAWQLGGAPVGPCNPECGKSRFLYETMDGWLDGWMDVTKQTRGATESVIQSLLSVCLSVFVPTAASVPAGMKFPPPPDIIIIQKK